MAEHKSKTIAVDIPIYEQEMVVHFGDLHDLADWLRKNTNISDTYKIVSEIEQRDNEGITVWGEKALVVRMETEPRTAEELSILVHELAHATNRALSVAGIDFSESSEEAYTYLLSFLTREVFGELEVFTSTS